MFFRQMTRFSVMFILLMVAAVLAGCSFISQAPPPLSSNPLGPTDVFSSRSEGEDGIVIETQGYTKGYIPGEEASLNFNVHNGSQQAWQTRYCLQLLSKESVLTTLISDQFSLQPGEGFGTVIAFNVPSDLTSGAYGLALVIPNRSASITTIQVGNGPEVPGGDWAEPRCP